MNKDTKVKCEVESCKHNNNNLCILEHLNISCTCNREDCSNQKETICKSFKKRT